MLKLQDLHLQYITDETGEKRSIILPISEFEALLEDLEGLAIVAERRDESLTSHDEIIAELKEDGLL